MKILLVDDEPDILEIVEGLLIQTFPHIQVTTCRDGDRALEALELGDIHLLITDLYMPRLDGEALLKVSRAQWPDVPVLIMSAHGTIDRAVALLKAGARDFITKPFNSDDLMHRVGLALEVVALQAELDAMRNAQSGRLGGSSLIFASDAMKGVIDRARLVAKSAAPVLITGESGTGKELLARELHNQGPRRTGPYVAVNCAAFSESLLEAELFGHERGAFTGADRTARGVIAEAHGGTLFLDEIGETSPTFQVKLLRFLQEGEVRPVGSTVVSSVDARVIAATNQDLGELMEAHSFRRDLFYRLNVIPMSIPPLRERPSDILVLAQHFLRAFGQESNRELILSPEAAQRLLEYRWPGNVRELENKMRRLAVLAPGERIQAEHLDLDAPLALRRRRTDSLSFAPGLTFQEAKRAAVDRFERTYLVALLRRHAGRPSRAAEEAGIDRKGLWRLMKKHSIELDGFRG